MCTNRGAGFQVTYLAVMSFLYRKPAGFSEELVSDSVRIRRKVVFPVKMSDEKHEETTQNYSDEDSTSDEAEAELESASDSDICSNSESESNNEMEVTREPESLNMEYKGAVPIAKDHGKINVNLDSESKRKKHKRKGALAEAEYKLLDMICEDVDDFGNEYEEDGHVHDESSDEVPAKKRKLTDDGMQENQLDR
jgi:hypothetical protein